MLIITCTCDLQGGLTLFVCAWAGEDVEKQATYGPFSLMLRLIIELSNGVLFPASSKVARELDPEQIPFQTLSGVCEEFAVQRQAASNTSVLVRIPAFAVSIHYVSHPMTSSLHCAAFGCYGENPNG
jgi:hypothetical protein